MNKGESVYKDPYGHCEHSWVLTGISTHQCEKCGCKGRSSQPQMEYLSAMKERDFLRQQVAEMRQAYDEFVEALKMIAFENDENTKFAKSVDEAKYYIDVAKKALAKHTGKK